MKIDKRIIKMIDQVCKEVMDIMNWNKKKAFIWCNAKNPMLGGLTPIEMILIGREDKLMKFIAQAKDDNLM